MSPWLTCSYHHLPILPLRGQVRKQDDLILSAFPELFNPPLFSSPPPYKGIKDLNDRTKSWTPIRQLYASSSEKAGTNFYSLGLLLLHCLVALHPGRCHRVLVPLRLYLVVGPGEVSDIPVYQLPANLGLRDVDEVTLHSIIKVANIDQIAI